MPSRPPIVTINVSVVRKLRRNAKRKWIPALKIPTDDIPRFSRQPYKWLLFLAYCLTGVQGHLTSSENSEDVVEEVEQITQTTSVYYHLPDAAYANMFPLDPDIAQSTRHTERSQREKSFRTKLLARDGRCVVSNEEDPDSLDGAHLVAFKKGNEYIKALTEARSTGPLDADIVADINDIRNGLLVEKGIHPKIGKDMAFLPVPNFAMTSDDVEIKARESGRCQTDDGRQWIVHYFKEVEDNAVNRVLRPHGAPIFLPPKKKMRWWPTDELFGALYGGSAIRHWLAPGFADSLRKLFEKDFYPSGAQESRDGGLGQVQKKRKRDDDDKADQQSKRAKRYTARNAKKNTGMDEELEEDPFTLLFRLHQISGGIQTSRTDPAIRVQNWRQMVPSA